MRGRLQCPVEDPPVDHAFGEEVTIGRAPDCSLVLAADVLSAHHARIAWDGDADRYVLEDLGSSNGTRLDGQRLRSPQPLGHLHVITLANQVELVFQDLVRCAGRHGAAASEPGSRTSIEVLPVPLPGQLASKTPSEKTLLAKVGLALPGLLRKPAAAGPAAAAAAPAPADPPPPTVEDALAERERQRAAPTVDWRQQAGASGAATTGEVADLGGPRPASAWVLEVTTEAGKNTFRLRPGANVVGRSGEADLVIQSPQVSRRHARLTVADGGLTIEDLGSRNGTFVGKQRIDRATAVTADQRLRFGDLRARLVAGPGLPPTEHGGSDR